MNKSVTPHYLNSLRTFIFERTSSFLLCFILVALLFNCKQNNTKNQSQNASELETYNTGELPIQRGMVLFNQHCASCHNFNETMIGPNLAGVTAEVSKAWLTSFINNPQKSIESGDERAVELYKKYNVYMPSFEYIKDEELEDLLGFIHSFSEAEKRSQNNRPGGILNPIPEKITKSDLTLVIKEFLTIPPSSETAPIARINKLVAVKSKMGERLFIADLRGKLYEVHDSDVQVFMDLNKELDEFVENPGWGTGLGSFDFHPEFESNGLLYTTHTEPARTSIADFTINDSIQTRMQAIVTEWKIDDSSAKDFTGSKRELLRADMLTRAHGFQDLTFNPIAKKGDLDYGLLYLGIGDAGLALSGYSHLCDNPGKIWGSIIRFDPLGRDSRNGKYGIPKDNPFVDDPDKLDEIWSYGFRNPHRISWDEGGTGKMYATNIGQHSLEEVNLIEKGANYGWPNREGTFLYDVNANVEIVYPLEDDDSEYLYPVIQFDHDEGNAISGGYAYAGTKITLLKNKYIFGDIPQGTLFYSDVSEMVQGKQAPIYRIGLEVNGKTTSLREIAKEQRVDLRFGQDGSRELFIFTKSNGKVYKVVDCKTNDNSF